MHFFTAKRKWSCFQASQLWCLGKYCNISLCNKRLCWPIQRVTCKAVEHENTNRTFSILAKISLHEPGSMTVMLCGLIYWCARESTHKYCIKWETHVGNALLILCWECTTKNNLTDGGTAQNLLSSGLPPSMSFLVSELLPWCLW